MNLRRKQQIWYILADLISSELVWLCFLGFRWMAYEGRVGILEDVLIPAFDFRLPLIIYPLVCLSVYYLSGYYLRPFQKPLWREFLRTFASAAIISLVFFFAIIIDDHVELVRQLGADGVHLGKKDMPVAQARQILGSDAIIGGTACMKCPFPEPARYANSSSRVYSSDLHKNKVRAVW